VPFKFAAVVGSCCNKGGSLFETGYQLLCRQNLTDIWSA